MTCRCRPGSIGVMKTALPLTGRASIRPERRDQRSVLLQRAQPGMAGLIDGSLSTLAPVFAVAFATHQPRFAFLAGLATAIGAGTFLGGILHIPAVPHPPG